MTGVLRRENNHPNKWVDMRDKSDCWIKRREGGGWGSYANVYRREGGGWNQIYPRTAVHADYRSVACGGRVAHIQSQYNKWKFEGVARQGYYSTGYQNDGFCDIHGSWFEGAGRVFQIDGASFSGTRNGSGYYNNNQNVYFYRSEQHPDENASPPFGRAGQFVGTSGAPGSGGYMDHRGLNNWNNIMDFVNQINGKGWLHIGGTSASADYFGMSNIKINLNYWYNVTYRVFSNPNQITQLSYKQEYEEIMNNPYHSMPIYPGEERLGLEEIYERRSILGLKDLDETSLINVTEEQLKFKPSNGEYSFKNNVFYIEMNNLYDSRALEYSLNEIDWEPALCNPSTGKYECSISQNIGKIYLRVRDYKTDEITYESVKETSAIIIAGESFDVFSLISEEDYYKYNQKY